ncbi:Gypsy retrotransposon integrase-like protein 1 [Balamuthia mandrillaris]
MWNIGSRAVWNARRRRLCGRKLMSHWVTSLQMSQMKQAKEMAKALLEIFTSTDLLKELLSDQGREFVNKLNNELLTLLGIKCKYAMAEHLQGNGMIE